MLMLVLTIKKNPTVCYWFLLFKQTIFKEKNHYLHNYTYYLSYFLQRI